MQHLELKVELSNSDMKRLGGELRCEDLASELPPGTKQRAVHFDTPEHNLHAAGLSVWLRRRDGHWLQTINADRHAADGTSHVVALESPVATRERDLAKIADKNVRRAVQKAVRGTSLNPVFETVVQRTSRKIKAQSGKPPLAMDGGAQPGKGATDISDAVLELKAGSADGLLLAVEKLLGPHELKLARRSKIERAYRLSKQSEARAKPEKSRPVRITRKNTCREAFSAILASAIEQITVNRQAALHTDDPEGAHQFRIGLRRLRSALRALRPFVDGSSLRAFERSAREMGRCVGMLRDADVLVSGIAAPMEQVASDKSGFAELGDALVRHRQETRDVVRSAFRGPQWTKLQLYLTLWPRTLKERHALDKPITKHARRILRKAWRKSARLGRRLDRLDDEHRHEMRKALKELRYQAEFFAPLFEKRVTRHFIEQLKALQVVFGYLNDARMAPRLFEVQYEPKAALNAARAASYTVGRLEAETAHVWRGASELWKRLKGSPRFWT
jgi:triphosphatase